jgi:hypothetical protein
VTFEEIFNRLTAKPNEVKVREPPRIEEPKTTAHITGSEYITRYRTTLLDTA